MCEGDAWPEQDLRHLAIASYCSCTPLDQVITYEELHAVACLSHPCWYDTTRLACWFVSSGPVMLLCSHGVLAVPVTSVLQVHCHITIGTAKALNLLCSVQLRSISHDRHTVAACNSCQFFEQRLQDCSSAVGIELSVYGLVHGLPSHNLAISSHNVGISC